jgi:hypothetical protein
MFSSQSSGAVNAVVNGAQAAVNGIANGATSMFNSVNKAANQAATNIAKNVPTFDSLIPIGNTAATGPAPNAGANANKNKNGKYGNGNGNGNTNSSSFFNFVNGNNSKYGNTGSNSSPANSGNTAKSGNTANSVVSGFPWLSPLYIFIGLVIVFVGVFSLYNAQIMQGYEYIVESIKQTMNLPTDPSVISAIVPTPADAEPEVTVPPEAPQTLTPDQEEYPQASQTSIVEKILPSSSGEVFNVAQNKFTYYDAEPLCKALGAELATYEQVKNAWGNGADWCNYGWVKGQMAIYPTQQETYDKLQGGPKEQRGACGTVGINGGFFENPEFKYGVNCYGKKPEQSAHDQEMLMSQGKAPRSPEALDVDEKVAEYRDQADSLFVKPFNDSKWQSS